MAGLPFTQLPAGDVSPEQDIQRQAETGRRNIQQKYALQWQTVNRNAKFLGQRKHQEMLMQIDSKAKAEMLEFNQRAEEQLASLRQIDNIAQAGGITPQTQEKLKATRVYGRETAEAMHPEPERERSIPQQFGELDLYGRRISQELEWFKPPKKLSKIATGIGAVSPLGRAILALRGKDDALRILDPNTGKWKEAEPEDVARYVALIREEKDIKQRKSELLGHPSIGRRKVQPGTKGGTFGDKIATSYKKPVTTQRQQPSAAELRRRGTRAAYDKGIELGYWE